MMGYRTEVSSYPAMPSEDKLAQWAAGFLAACNAPRAGNGRSGQDASAAATDYAGVTPAARLLLQTVDAGGVPAFVTARLKEIAEENGIAVADHWTPNEIVDALRDKARSAGAEPAADG